MAASVVASIALPISNNFSFAPSMDAYGKLSEYGKLGAWSPLSLFAASEVGAWYDPSDLSTMFQDIGGTTPVTADGQPVGLILDKSKGGWTNLVGTWGKFDGDGVVTIVGNTVTITGATTLTRVDFVNGNTYGAGVEMDATFSSASPFVYLGASGMVSVAGRHRYTSGPNGSLIRVQIASGDVTFQVHSLREAVGNHARQSTAASRPLKTSTGAADWINYDAVDDVLNTTFPSSLGSSCTVCRANVGGAPTILTGQTVGTSYADSTDNAGLIIINRALTGQETTDVTAWLTAKGATA